MNRQVFRVAGAGEKQVVPAFIGMHVEKHVCFEVADSAEVRQGGVDADDAFRMCRNLMCNMQPVFNELKTDEHTVKNAIEMRTALDNYIKANEKSDE